MMTSNASKIGFTVLLSALLLVFTSEVLAQSTGGDESGKEAFIRYFDQDGDGLVSRQEFAGPEDAFAHFDRNQDGVIDVSEAPSKAPRQPRGNFIQHFDQDGDGRVSREEFPGPDEAFDQHDVNQDGYLDTTEAPEGRPVHRNRSGSPTPD